MKHFLKLIIGVLKALAKAQGADDVRDGVVDDGEGVERVLPVL